MSDFSKDPDMTRFIADLQDSGPGVRWRRAWMEMQRCVKQIKEVSSATDMPARVQQTHVLVLQRRYIKASEFASEALDELSVVHNWPPESTAHVGFKLVAPARRQARKAP